MLWGGIFVIPLKGGRRERDQGWTEVRAKIPGIFGRALGDSLVQNVRDTVVFFFLERLYVFGIVAQ